MITFFRSPFFLPWLYPGLTWKLPTVDKKIYLTFDDGPVPGPTEFVLDELKRVGARATFFCIGDNVRKHPEVFNKVVTAGHRTGNHTFNHLRGWETETERYLDNIRQCDKVMGLEQTSNKLFRPPYGRITRKQISRLSDYRIVMWDVLTHDYSKQTGRHRCLNGSIRATRPGSVVVFHDSLKAERNLRFVLPRYLDHFSQAGYSFEPLP